MTFLDYAHPYVDAEISCSKGTYIRVIAHDLGALLGCGAALHTLKRTRHGEFEISRSVPLDSLKAKQDIVKYMIPLEDVMQAVRGVAIEPVLEKFLKNGMPVPLLGGSRDWKQGELAKIMNRDGDAPGYRLRRYGFQEHKDETINK